MFHDVPLPVIVFCCVSEGLFVSSQVFTKLILKPLTFGGLIDPSLRWDPRMGAPSLTAGELAEMRSTEWCEDTSSGWKYPCYHHFTAANVSKLSGGGRWGVLHEGWYGESGDVVCSWLMNFWSV